MIGQRWLYAGMALLALSASPLARASNHEVRTFPSGAAWYVYGGPVETVLYIADAAEPSCQGVGEIILIFEHRDQLLDEDLTRRAALAGMERYRALCADLGQPASSQRAIIGVLRDNATPDERGRLPAQAHVLGAYVTTLGRTDGGDNVLVRQNLVLQKAKGEVERKAAAQQQMKFQRQLNQ